MNDQSKIWLLAVFLCISSLSSAQKTMTLEQCIDTGIRENFDVEQRRIAAQSEQLEYQQSKLNLLPDLNGSAGHGFNQGRSIDPFTNSPVTQSFNSSNFSLASGLVLFSGLSRMNNIRRADLSRKAAQMELQQEKDNLAINITLAYLQVLSLTEQAYLLEDQAKLSLQQVDRLDILNREGAIKPSELSDLKGQFANDRLTITDNKNNLGNARLSLFRLMNIPYDSTLNFEPMDSYLPMADNRSSSSIYQAALQQLALVKAVDLRTFSSIKSVQMARGGLWPTLSLGGNAYTQYSSVARQNQFQNTSFRQTEDYVALNGQQYPLFVKQDNYLTSSIPYGTQLNNNLNSSLNLTLSIPIFNALQQRNKIKQAQLEVKRNATIAADTKRQLQQDIDVATLNMQTAIEKYETLLQQVAAYRESFEAAEARFNEGVGNSIDYLTAKNNLDRASRNLVNARYDYILRKKVLSFYSNNAF
ncbi:TolC family protein [Niabella yanshanensis]|uniref:TolC family protein n=1 Tax=Niabella yanshanensis TaxID=577386 RepID=A0ABZ0W9S5_9BACT|nr:TolC family protein [Niabella yanshanensis]WQD38282.1 TolC family protein [Niabella yanshanensis]